GCKVAIGSIYYNERRGRAYVFEYTNTGIVLIGDYYSDDVNPNTNYGWCVHVDQDNICTIYSCSLTESDEYDFKDTFKL
ncbi:MAG: hypothetical protein WC981_02800, partial [Candidatus Dojkabacteria bacterium]